MVRVVIVGQPHLAERKPHDRCSQARMVTKAMNYLERLRLIIEESYETNPTGCGGSFGEILCWEIHTNELTFVWLAEKWGVGLPTLGELIWDHCKRLEQLPQVNHDFSRD